MTKVVEVQAFNAERRKPDDEDGAASVQPAHCRRHGVMDLKPGTVTSWTQALILPAGRHGPAGRRAAGVRCPGQAV
jgi:hypothetical protein